MATFDPTKPPLSLEDKLAASPPAASVTGTTKLLTPSLETVEVRLTQLAPAERAAAGDTVQVIGALNEDGSYDAATLAAIAVKRAEGWPDNAIYVNIIGALPPVNAKTPAERAADGEVVQILGYTTAEGGYDAATLALIADKQAAGWPDYSIWVRVLGTTPTSTASASAMVPAFAAMTVFMSPTVAGQQVATGTVAQFSAMAAFISPTVSAQRLASASVPQFSAVSTFAAPTVYATRNASATVPQFAASATFAAPSVTVTPAGATAASVTVPSFGAVVTLTSPSVTAQGAATASVPSFSALASFSAASVTGQRLATAVTPQFSAIASLSAPSVTGVAQTLATVAVPQFAAVSTLTAPPVAATRVATASVPSFGATAAFAAPTVAGVQQAAAVSATATVPSFTSKATLTAPSVAGTTVGGTPTTLTETFTTASTTFPYTGSAAIWSETVLGNAYIVVSGGVANLVASGGTATFATTIAGQAAGKLKFTAKAVSQADGYIEVFINNILVYQYASDRTEPDFVVRPRAADAEPDIPYSAGTNTYKFEVQENTGDVESTLYIDSVTWVPNS